MFWAKLRDQRLQPLFRRSWAAQFQPQAARGCRLGIAATGTSLVAGSPTARARHTLTETCGRSPMRPIALLAVQRFGNLLKAPATLTWTLFIQVFQRLPEAFRILLTGRSLQKGWLALCPLGNSPGTRRPCVCSERALVTGLGGPPTTRSLPSAAFLCAPDLTLTFHNVNKRMEVQLPTGPSPALRVARLPRAAQAPAGSLLSVWLVFLLWCSYPWHSVTLTCMWLCSAF